MADVVCRRTLHARLDAGIDLPLALVSASAGYGKSTLVSHWLASCVRPSGWLSLDEGDGDLRTFLQYFIAAVQTIAPDSCKGMGSLLDSMELPTVTALGACLASYLSKIPDSFVLVFDDYHRLGATPEHDLLGALLEHPPRSTA
jgi:LuxR family maltose regulon positive regulatory protein